MTSISCFFFFHDTATTEIYTLSLHDALPIYTSTDSGGSIGMHSWNFGDGSTSTAASPSHTYASAGTYSVSRSEEHTSELPSRRDLVCRLLLEKKNKN